MRYSGNMHLSYYTSWYKL